MNAGSSFFGDKNSKKLTARQESMRKDRDNFRRKLCVLEKKMQEEETMNNKHFQRKMGEFVEYGNEI